MAKYIYDSPIGKFLLVSDKTYLTGLYFVEEPINAQEETPVILETIKQLDEYFKGIRKEFTLPLYMEGTPFRKKVWQALTKIPYGQTKSYKEIAAAIDAPKAVRAVGGANHVNPISIIVPCHRVVGANGAMVGYGGGLWRKEWLIAHEKQYLDKAVS